jgi:hypothetical protein
LLTQGPPSPTSGRRSRPRFFGVLNFKRNAKAARSLLPLAGEGGPAKPGRMRAGAAPTPRAAKEAGSAIQKLLRRRNEDRFAALFDDVGGNVFPH